MEILIDEKSGFCFGVKRAIERAEEEASKTSKLYCLGEIVHNSEEVERLRRLGITFIDRETFFTLSDCKVLFRAHGEPPETYNYAKEHHIEIIDATCPVVLKLQEKVRRAKTVNAKAQLVIYGRAQHPEVVGLRGQVDGTLIVEKPEDLSSLDYTKPVYLFAQTTKDRQGFADIKAEIAKRIHHAGQPEDNLVAYDSICGQVANRAPWLAEFSQTVDTLLFVGGKNSSNSKMLFNVCRNHNPSSHFVTSPEDVKNIALPPDQKIGITGATSTPRWLIEEVAEILKTRRRT